MAKYSYKCKDCDFEQEENHGMNETPEIVCENCGKTGMSKMIPKSLNFILKGASWSGKNSKEKSYRLKRKQEMGKKMASSHDIPSISPNYKGELCKNWEEAKKLAKADGVDSLRYERQVQNLQSQQKNLEEKKKKLLRGEG